MKFTCDSCGAQYLISDDKIGARGVKVRCKKCSNVIILRPEAVAANGANGASANGSGASSGPVMGGSASSVPVAPSVAAAQASSSLPDDVVAATSSDLGLSQEFRALGFEDASGPAPRAATLSVGLDLHGTPSDTGSLSPFSAERAGGSLDFVPPEPSPDSTAVQARPAVPFDDEETEMLGDKGEPGDSPTVAETTDRQDLSAPVGLGSSAPADVADDEAAATRVENLGQLAAAEDDDDDDVHEEEDETQLGESPLGAQPLTAESWQGEATRTSDAPVGEDPATAGPLADSADLGAALDAVQRDEMADMVSSLEGEVAGLSDAISGFSDEAPKTEVGAAEPGPDAADDGASALAALADAEDDDDGDVPTAAGLGSTPSGAADADADAGDGLVVAGTQDSPFADGAGMDMPVGEDSIADEIGSAFQAMFGEDDGAAEASPGGSEVEDELAALQTALGADETNKAETRVFDTDAMAKVEAEQERAAAEVEHDAPEPKEWYVAIEEEQVGPLSRSEVQAHWDEGRLQADSLCWRAGMSDWLPVNETEGLAGLVPPEPEPRVPTVLPGSADDGEDALVAPAVDAGPEAVAEPEPPKITPEPEPAPAARAESEPGWRPSAASALASLAAEELSEAPEPAPAPLGAAPAAAAADTGAAALPASDALEKLLEGEPDKSAASQFGAAEKSESYVRPLPRRADTVSSLPLRDPTTEKQKSNWAVPASILGGFLLLGLMVLGGIQLLKSDDEPTKTPEAALAKAAPARPGLVDAPPPAAPDEAAKAAAEAEAKAKLEAEAKAKAEAEAKAQADAEAAKKAEADKGKKSKRRRKGRKRRSRTTEAPTPVAAKAVVAEPPPAPKPRATPKATSEEDLLGVAAKPAPRRRRAPEPEPEPELPDQLDDSDVLQVLRSNRGDVRRCLKAQAQADTSLEGTMTVELVIRRSGRPKGVRVREDKFKRSAVGTCMVAAVKRWRFPKFSGASMPLDFPVRVRAR